MQHLLPDAILAGEGIRAGLLGAAAAPVWGAAGALALVAPVLVAVLARLLALGSEDGAEGQALPLEGASPANLRLVARVCAAIAALFALVSAEALGVLPLSALSGLLVGTALFATLAWRCWGMARVPARRGGRR